MLKINYKNFHITITKNLLSLIACQFVIINCRISGKIPCPYLSLLLLLLTANRVFLSENLENDVHFFQKSQSVPSALLVTVVGMFLVW